MPYDLTTIVTENYENQEDLADKLFELESCGWIQAFDGGWFANPANAIEGRDAYEILVSREHRLEVAKALAAIHYTLVEGV